MNESPIGTRLDPKRDVDQALADLKASVERDRADAARMREIDALVGAMAARCPEKRDAAALLSAALLSAAAVEAADDAEVAELRNNPNWTAQSVKRAIIRAAIRAAGVEPVERTQSCPRCDMHAEEAKQLGQTLDQVARYIGRMHEPEGHADHRASDAEIIARCRELSVTEEALNTCHVNHRKASIDRDTEKARADKAERERDVARESAEQRLDKLRARVSEVEEHRDALQVSFDRTIDREDKCRAEADALRAEVAALRGLGTSAAAISAAREAYDYPAADQVVRFSTVLHAALATVPPAKVASAPKPEAPGVEPLETAPGEKLSPWGKAIQDRVNVLSAIAKRGGL